MIVRVGNSLIAEADALSALAWWQLSGVDVVVDDDVRNWLQSPPGRTAAATIPAPGPASPSPAGPSALPHTLDAFRTWLGNGDHAFLPAGPRIMPAGSAASGLMLLCGQPEISERHTLFEGAAGQLLDGMLAALGLNRESVYIASISPVHLPSRVAPALQQQLAELARHHIGLAAPRAMLLIGDLAAQLLLGQPVAALRGRLHDVNHSGGRVAAVPTFHPRLLLTTPACKAQSWQDLRLLLKEFGR